MSESYPFVPLQFEHLEPAEQMRRLAEFETRMNPYEFWRLYDEGAFKASP